MTWGNGSPVRHRRRRASAATTIGVVAATVWVVAACSSPGTSAGTSGSGASTSSTGRASSASPGTSASAPKLAPPDATKRPYPVVHTQRTYVDESRKTPAGMATPELPTRTLVTELYRPQGEGPFPLIMFSHGLVGHPDKFTRLLERWAEAGYLVVAPTFPLSNRKVEGANGNAKDVWNQPADVSFVLDQLLAENGRDGAELHGAIDPARLGAGGLSLGGATTLGLAYNPCCRDDRFIAFEVLAGNPIPLSEAYDFADATPVLFVHGDNDRSLSIATELETYRKAKDPKWFVTLLGAPHAPPFEDDPTVWDAYVEDITTAFWDLELAPGRGGADRAAEATFGELIASAPDLARPEPHP